MLCATWAVTVWYPVNTLEVNQLDHSCPQIGVSTPNPLAQLHKKLIQMELFLACSQAIFWWILKPVRPRFFLQHTVSHGHSWSCPQDLVSALSSQVLLKQYGGDYIQVHSQWRGNIFVILLPRKGLGVLVDTKLNVSQKCALTLCQQTHRVEHCQRVHCQQDPSLLLEPVEATSGILCPALGFSVEDMDKLMQVQQRAIKMINGLKHLSN